MDNSSQWIILSYCVIFIWIPLVQCVATPGTDSSNAGDIQGSPGTLREPITSTRRSEISTPVPVTHRDNTTLPWPSHCKIMSQDEYTYQRVQNLLELNAKLIEYRLSFPNYTINPLHQNISWSYQADRWARVSSKHGQTLLSLAFNYGVLSLMTLTMGTESLSVELIDSPLGCFGDLSEDDKIHTITYLLLRDFKHDEDVLLVDDERVCHEIIQQDGVNAMFKDRCCHRHELSKELVCTTAVMNIWLKILHGLLAFVRFTVLFFGPVLFIPIVESLSNQNFPYVVKLKDPLYKTICTAKTDTHIPKNYKCNFVLDFRKCRGLSKLRMSSSDAELGKPSKVRINEYNILVDYRKLLPENDVPVGLWTSISRAIFQCKLREVGPFKRCCKANMFSLFPSRNRMPWIAVWSKIGRLLMILLMPMPFYIRLIIYYCFEIDELDNRKNAAANIGLRIPYDKSLLHYLSPTHGLFISMYCLYFVTAIVLAYMARADEKGKFRSMLVGSFTDLKYQSWINIFQVAVKNFVWPFQRYGIIGCVVAILYWPVAIPYSLVMFLLFCLPAVYMTARMAYYSQKALRNKITKKKRGRSAYRVEKEKDDTTQVFDVGYLHNKVTHRKEADDDIESLSTISRATITSKRSRLSSTSTALSVISTMIRENTSQCWQIFTHVTAAILLIITMYAVLFLLSECIGCVVEIVTFTLMGIIINAGTVLKYVMLFFLVMLYCHDAFNNVPKKYLKLNKAIFNEVKGRCKDLDKVTSLPSSLQVNFGFKSQELGEQADYESPDDIWRKHPRHWLINDLTLFVDNEDFPRIPKRLFEDVCQVRVAGAPGPVWRSLIDAFKDLLKIVCFLFFVFLIVLSFGFVYKVSTTNQMLATTVGGFLPFILKTFLAPNRPDIEIGTVSFKSKMDEIIKNFYQIWPIYDFPFEIMTEEEIKELENQGKEGSDASGSDKGSINVQVNTQEDVPDSKASENKIPPPPNYDDASNNRLLPWPHGNSRDPKDLNQNVPNQARLASPEKSSMKSSNPDLKKVPSQSEVTFDDVAVHKRSLFRRQRSKATTMSTELQALREDEDGEEVQVDYLIFLPEPRRNEDWLDEWSDFGEYSEPVFPEDEAEEITALKENCLAPV